MRHYNLFSVTGKGKKFKSFCILSNQVDIKFAVPICMLLYKSGQALANTIIAIPTYNGVAPAKSEKTNINISRLPLDDIAPSTWIPVSFGDW